MKRWIFGLVVVVLGAALLVGCGSSEEATPAAESGAGGAGYTSEVLVTSYPGALDASSQLALGTLELEGTENAVTPEQAATLLPLWQALQGGVTVEAEINAVLAQIERTMTPEQLAAIAALQLTVDDMAAWAEENGIMFFVGGGPMGEGQGQAPSEEEQAAIRATVEAGGGPQGGFGGAPPQGFSGTPPADFGSQAMSEEEQAAIRATVEAGGGMPAGGQMPGGGRPGGAGRGAVNVLIEPLVELLTQRAGE